MEFKGTKGRWYLQEYTDAYTNIVRCNDGNGFETLFIAYTPQSTLPEARANALLISKAPEMLEMLKELKDRFEYFNDKVSVSEIEQLIKESTEL